MSAGTIILEPFNGGLSVARSLVRAGERVAMVSGETSAYATRSRGVRGHVAPEAEWLRALEDLAREGEWALVCGVDGASEWLARHRDALPAGIRCFEAADDAHLPLMGKDTSDALARAAGVKVPWTATVPTLAALEAVLEQAPWPCVLKPVHSHRWRQTMGEERVLLVRDGVQARREAERALAAGYPMVLSEYVPGGDGDVEEAIVVRAADGSYPVAFGCRKIRQYPVGFGVASLCEAAELPESLALARAVLDHAGYVGVAGVETKRHAKTGERYFLEVNVRIPTQFGLGDAAGLQASRRLAAVARGEPVGPQPPLRPGARLVFPQHDARAVAAALRRGVSPRAIAASYRGTRDFGILDPRDPRPGLAVVAGAVRARIAR
jgi:predicted ATP-grasp superfamily ATP-dependent carboligase